MEKWNIETILEYAKNCKTRKEFYEKNSWVSERARDLGIIEDCRKLLPQTKNKKWTMDEVREIAKKYEHIVDFKKGDNNAWQWASRKNAGREEFYKEITSHMKPKGTRFKKLLYRADFPNNTVYFGITYDLKERMDGHGQNGSVYDYAQIIGIEPNFTQLTDLIDIKTVLKLEKTWVKEYKEKGWNVLNKTSGGEAGCVEEWITKDLCHKEALKYQYRWEFGKNSPSFYRKALEKKWMDDICSHMEEKNMKWDKHTILEYAKNSNFTTITEFAKLCKGAYYSAKRLGIRNQLKQLFEWKGGKTWTKEEIHQIALKYTKRKLFDQENHNACVYAQRKGWYDEITSHMGYQPHGKKWTKEEVHIEAKKYRTRNQFARASDTKGCNKAYQAAIHNGWIDEVCSHMPPPKTKKKFES